MDLDGLRVIDRQVPGPNGPVALRRYSSPGADDRTTPFLWVHGGAWFGGNLDSRETVAPAQAIAALGRTVFTVDYRRVPLWRPFVRRHNGVLPGTRFPVPVDDVIAAFEHVRDVSGTGQATLGGGSAGANLCAGAVIRMRSWEHPLPKGVVLVYGLFHPELPPIEPHLRERVGGLHGLLQFRPGTIRALTGNYAGSVEATADPEAFPGGHDLTRFPQTLLVDADRDTIRSSGERFHAELLDAGVDVEYQVVPDVYHGFLAHPGRPGFRRGIADIAAWLDELESDRSD